MNLYERAKPAGAVEEASESDAGMTKRLVEQAIETQAVAKGHKNQTPAQAVAKFLETPDGMALYEISVDPAAATRTPAAYMEYLDKRLYSEDMKVSKALRLQEAMRVVRRLA
jgi:hypothetical protein